MWRLKSLAFAEACADTVPLTPATLGERSTVPSPPLDDQAPNKNKTPPNKNKDQDKDQDKTKETPAAQIGGEAVPDRGQAIETERDEETTSSDTKEAEASPEMPKQLQRVGPKFQKTRARLPTATSDKNTARFVQPRLLLQLGDLTALEAQRIPVIPLTLGKEIGLVPQSSIPMTTEISLDGRSVKTEEINETTKVQPKLEVQVQATEINPKAKAKTQQRPKSESQAKKPKPGATQKPRAKPKSKAKPKLCKAPAVLPPDTQVKAKAEAKADSSATSPKPFDPAQAERSLFAILRTMARITGWSPKPIRPEDSSMSDLVSSLNYDLAGLTEPEQKPQPKTKPPASRGTTALLPIVFNGPIKGKTAEWERAAKIQETGLCTDDFRREASWRCLSGRIRDLTQVGARGKMNWRLKTLTKPILRITKSSLPFFLVTGSPSNPHHEFMVWVVMQHWELFCEFSVIMPLSQLLMDQDWASKCLKDGAVDQSITQTLIQQIDSSTKTYYETLSEIFQRQEETSGHLERQTPLYRAKAQAEMKREFDLWKLQVDEKTGDKKCLSDDEKKLYDVLLQHQDNYKPLSTSVDPQAADEEMSGGTIVPCFDAYRDLLDLPPKSKPKADLDSINPKLGTGKLGTPPRDLGTRGAVQASGLGSGSASALISVSASALISTATQLQGR